MSLFSIFDPSSKWFFITNWAMLILPVILTPVKLFNCTNYELMITKVLGILSDEARPAIKFNWKTVLFCSLFMLIVMLNLAGLLPYVLAVPSHMSFSLTLSLVLWTAIMLYGVIRCMDSLLIHLVPYGCPDSLMFFMVIIESVSSFIRPLTLAIRLSANIMAGHVILSLVSSFSVVAVSGFLVSAFFQSILLVLEIAVAVVQPYVFFSLLTLYKGELVN